MNKDIRKKATEIVTTICKEYINRRGIGSLASQVDARNEAQRKLNDLNIQITWKDKFGCVYDKTQEFIYDHVSNKFKDMLGKGVITNARQRGVYFVRNIYVKF